MSALEIEVVDGVAWVTLNRPDSLNAINDELATELVERVVPLSTCGDVRVVVVRGSGRAFCAGADVGAASTEAEMSVAEKVAGHARLQRTLEAFAAMPVVKIAQVHGHCVGAGLVLATMCELRYASTGAKFSVPELDFGIPFSMGGLPTVARYLGITRTADLVLTGRRMGADEARTSGLITEVVANDDLPTTVRDVAARVATRPAFLLQETVSRLEEAGRALLDGQRSDLSSLVLATMDAESRAVMDAYAERIVGDSR
ncbi:enoyl-CoA hydratase/isomerase family protein [Dietzia sp. ANT_WB102]|uniref:enoyl-CoA hydratase/isomerase family protein n=1 Tax=Dietzia sp. ANT_WB102 TaxID=2597345 RepID=UPI0011ECE3D9|nr:enoyl-CoA hydratase/isomerase family protein [Dietzia sp. ANT_WB102]KAA0918401.1 enoyl-CoA hydratase/isomerase family protein [Dietzia sp. ANT_WB102]